MAEGTDRQTLAQPPATPTLKALANELKSVLRWHTLGVNLDLKIQQLGVIEKNHRGDDERCRTEMLACWLDNAANPTWEAVAEALDQMDEGRVSDEIRRKYITTAQDLALVQQSVSTTDGTNVVPSSHNTSSAIGSQLAIQAPVLQHVDGSLVHAKNLQKMKDIFASLIALAERVLQGKDINIPNFRLFLMARYLPEEDSNDARAIDPSKFVNQVLGTAQSITEILQSLMIHRLLSYKNIDVLCSIVNHYASDDIEMKRKLGEYEEELAGYILVTKIIDHLDVELQESVSEPDPELLHELSVKVKANVTEKTLKYVSELRDSLAYRVKLPVTALLFHKIAEGCVEISWLLPCHLAEFTTRQLEESTDYFQEESILQVTIDGRCIYEQLLPEQEKTDPEKRDPDDPDAGNLTSVHDVPDAERLDSLQRQLIDDEPEGPEDIPEHEQGVKCGRVICTNYSLLYGHLDPEKLLPKLPEKGLIDEEDLVIVESFHEKFARNVYIIRTLLWYDRPSHGLLKFCDTLETTPGQEHLGNKLLKEYKHPSLVHVQSPDEANASHCNLFEFSELFQQLQREVMDLLDQFPNALAKLKQVVASLVLPIDVGEVVPVVDPPSYESAETVQELFSLMAPYWNPLSTDLFGLLLEASGCNQAASTVAEYVQVRANKGHLVLCTCQLPTLGSDVNNLGVVDFETVHNAPLSELQSLHPAIFARLPEHKVTSTRATVRISVEVNRPLLCIADYERIVAVLSGFLQVPNAALVYAGCSKTPLVLCWLASHDIVAYIRLSKGGLLPMSAHRLLVENDVTQIAVGDRTYKCPTIEVVELWEACQYGLVEHAHYLLATDVDVNMTTYYGATPLYIACQNGHLPVVEHLIAAKADVNTPKEIGLKPLHIACQQGHLQVVQHLIAAKADVNSPLNDGAMPLHIACQEGHLPVVQHLIGAKADVNTPKKTGATPLFVACQEGHLPVVEHLIAAKADVNTAKEGGVTPLHIACREGHLPVVQHLIAAKALVDTSLKGGATPLYVACQKGHLQVVEYLIAAKADVNTSNEDGWTPLFIACQEEHVPVVEHLIAAKADINHQDEDGTTPLMVAAYHGHPSIARLLLQTGATINTTDQSWFDTDGKEHLGGTALHIAVNQQHEEVVEVLLEANADPDLQQKESQETALMIAARKRNVGIVRKLIHHGASVNLTNKDGLTAFDVASIEGHMDVCQELWMQQSLFTVYDDVASDSVL